MSTLEPVASATTDAAASAPVSLAPTKKTKTGKGEMLEITDASVFEPWIQSFTLPDPMTQRTSLVLYLLQFVPSVHLFTVLVFIIRTTRTSVRALVEDVIQRERKSFRTFVLRDNQHAIDATCAVLDRLVQTHLDSVPNSAAGDEELVAKCRARSTLLGPKIKTGKPTRLECAIMLALIDGEMTHRKTGSVQNAKKQKTEGGQSSVTVIATATAIATADAAATAATVFVKPTPMRSHVEVATAAASAASFGTAASEEHPSAFDPHTGNPRPLHNFRADANGRAPLWHVDFIVLFGILQRTLGLDRASDAYLAAIPYLIGMYDSIATRHGFPRFNLCSPSVRVLEKIESMIQFMAEIEAQRTNRTYLIPEVDRSSCGDDDDALDTHSHSRSSLPSAPSSPSSLSLLPSKQEQQEQQEQQKRQLDTAMVDASALVEGDNNTVAAASVAAADADAGANGDVDFQNDVLLALLDHEAESMEDGDYNGEDAC